jgi:hypothetical protein
MIPSSRPSYAQDGLPGYPNPRWLIVWRKRTIWRRMKMSYKRYLAARRAEADANRYRRYHEAKRKIPMDLPPAEYEAEVKRLAKKFKI